MNTKWEFQVNLRFSTSGSNYTDVYLISDKADLKNSSINGYFVRIGNTDDEISLYKRSGPLAGSTKIIDGVNNSVTSAPNTVKVRVSRSNSGLFKLEREILSSNSTYITEGDITDLSFTTSTHFGICIQQSTPSFFQKHFFDNFKIDTIVTDTIPPELIFAAAIDSNTIELTFNEIMDSASVKALPNFSIDNNAIISQIRTTENPLRYWVKVLNSLNTATYRVSMQNVRDISGNNIRANNTASFSFIKPYLAKYGDMVINEIFPDPSPQLDLPSVEFAELRNNTGYPISLKNWKFSDPGSSSNFGDITIESGSFLVLCAKSDTAEFKRFGKVLGLSPWPSLNNSGDAIKLISSENVLIDSVSYTDSWYRNSVKKQGGWTLERRDPRSKCESFLNWTASADSSGGTPGRENSSYVSGYDQIMLKTDSLRQVSDTIIKVYFNKHINGSTLLSENFNLTPTTALIKKLVTDAEFKEVTIIYDQKFLPGTDYSLVISNLKGCSGIVANPINITFKTSKLPLPIRERGDTSKIIITEIFADPSPEVGLPLTEFIEIFNPSKDTVDLDKWTISDPATNAILNNQKILPSQYLILCPATDTVHYKPFGKTVGLSPWPSLNNSSEQIALKSFKNRVVDSIAYSDTWYHSTSKKHGGWTLEKIDLNSVCEGFFNWTASKDTSGGTPGRKNSVYFSGYDLLALTADSLKQASDTTIKIYFNKHLDSSTLIAENFSLAPYAAMKKIIADAELKEVTLTYTQKLKAGTEYVLAISKVKDCSKLSISNTDKLTFRTAKLPVPMPERTDTSIIIITEIFADPSPEIGLPLSEFIEIFNPSKDTVNLDKWAINDPTTKTILPPRKILPLEYLILCPAADTVHYKPFGKTV
ncbi:MAG: lamin tail domain-containing protein, partial [Daejeonella sp.]